MAAITESLLVQGMGDQLQRDALTDVTIVDDYDLLIGTLVLLD